MLEVGGGDIGIFSVIRASKDPSIPRIREIWLWTHFEGIITLSRVSGAVIGRIKSYRDSMVVV